jgi:hypothetical protein
MSFNPAARRVPNKKAALDARHLLSEAQRLVGAVASERRPATEWSYISHIAQAGFHFPLTVRGLRF